MNDLSRYFHLSEVPDIAFAVKLLRRSHQLSQRDLAKKLGVPRTYISSVENGKKLPTIETLERLAQALFATTAALILIGQAKISSV